MYKIYTSVIIGPLLSKKYNHESSYLEMFHKTDVPEKWKKYLKKHL